MRFSVVIFVLLAIGCRVLRSQSAGTASNPDSATSATLYSGRYEARIGTSFEPSQDRLRLDIGGTHNLLYVNSYSMKEEGTAIREEWERTVSIGADFFTWTRLRATRSFKFPVEAVDYYFGLNSAVRFNGALPINELRLRLAHISAHLVDGDTGLAGGSRSVTTYSREFVDLMASGSLRPSSGAFVRLYAGGEWLFHTIPDTVARLSPYLGADGHYRLWGASTTARAGLELRLNPDYDGRVEVRGRLGIKFNRPDATGLLVEAGYNRGRSAYGQYYDRTEEFGWIGFGIDFSALWLTTK